MRKILSLVLLLSLFIAVPVFAQDDSDITSPDTTVSQTTSQTTLNQGAATTVTPNQVTVEDIVENNFIVLRDAIARAGLVQTLQGGEYTLFAPTDGAFQTLANDLEISLNDLLANRPLLQGVLNYHVIPSTVTADDILTGIPVTETVEGDNLSFGYDSGISRVVINGGEASVEQPNIFATNGVVHVIDNVLLPPNYQELLMVQDTTPPSELTMSNMDFIDDSFVVLSAAIDAAGLRDTINSGTYTILAPTDGAFQTWLNEMGISQDALLQDMDLLTSVLQYHVIPDRVTSDQIRNGTADTSTVFGTSASFGYDSGISRVTINGGRATIAQPDIYTNNGIVHIIDNVLLPPQ